MLAKNFFKIIYKLEMNFSLWAFGMKEGEEIQMMMNYIINLFEFTLYVI